jgi:hypothetical protein
MRGKLAATTAPILEAKRLRVLVNPGAGKLGCME